jgi:hypothetical protein
LVAPPPWLHVAEGLARAGFDDREPFNAWVDATPGESGEVETEAIRRAVRRRGAIVTATPTGGISAVPLASRAFAHVRPDPRRLVKVVAQISGISELALCSRRRNPAITAARRVAVHCGKALGLSGSDLAAALAMSPQGVSRIGLRSLEAKDALAYQIAYERMVMEVLASGGPSLLPMG